MSFMNIAIKEAIKAFEKNEVPIGAVLVKDNKIIAKAHNLREKKKDVIAHAEILCIQKASKKLKNWKLYNLDLYVTLKPCEMCQNVIKQARIDNVYYLIDRIPSKKEYNKTNYNIINDAELENFSQKLLSDFFIKKR